MTLDTNTKRNYIGHNLYYSPV